MTQIFMDIYQLIPLSSTSFRVSLFIDLGSHKIWGKGGGDTLALLW